MGKEGKIEIIQTKETKRKEEQECYEKNKEIIDKVRNEIADYAIFQLTKEELIERGVSLPSIAKRTWGFAWRFVNEKQKLADDILRDVINVRQFIDRSKGNKYIDKDEIESGEVLPYFDYKFEKLPDSENEWMLRTNLCYREVEEKYDKKQKKEIHKRKEISGTKISWDNNLKIGEKDEDKIMEEKMSYLWYKEAVISEAISKMGGSDYRLEDSSWDNYLFYKDFQDDYY